MTPSFETDPDALLSLANAGLAIVKKDVRGHVYEILQHVLSITKRLSELSIECIDQNALANVQKLTRSALLNHLRQTELYGDEAAFCKRLKLVEGKIAPQDILKTLVKHFADAVIPDWLLTYFLEHPNASAHYELFINNA